MEIGDVSAPRVLHEDDDVRCIETGVKVVDDWAHKRAHRAMKQGTAVVYVALFASRPVGFYALNAHSVCRDEAGGWLRRNTPEQIPAILLGMLGVDKVAQGIGLGKALLRDAILRAQEAAQSIGARALLVDPADERAAGFYRRYGFRELEGSPRLFLPLH